MKIRYYTRLDTGNVEMIHEGMGGRIPQKGTHLVIDIAEKPFQSVKMRVEDVVTHIGLHEDWAEVYLTS